MAEDDKQTELMDQFLEKITPKLTEAVMGKVSETLAATEKTIGDRLDGIASKNDQLLGKLHKEKGERTSLEDQLATLNKHLTGDTEPMEVVISKADARDVSKYRAARAKAEEAGIPLRIDRDAG